MKQFLLALVILEICVSLCDAEEMNIRIKAGTHVLNAKLHDNDISFFSGMGITDIIFEKAE